MSNTYYKTAYQPLCWVIPIIFVPYWPGDLRMILLRLPKGATSVICREWNAVDVLSLCGATTREDRK